MLSPFVKGAAVSALTLTIVICLMINGARAESYGSDAPNAGAPAAQAKSKPVKIVPKHYVVHPQVDTSTSRKRGK